MRFRIVCFSDNTGVTPDTIEEMFTYANAAFVEPT